MKKYFKPNRPQQPEDYYAILQPAPRLSKEEGGWCDGSMAKSYDKKLCREGIEDKSEDMGVASA